LYQANRSAHGYPEHTQLSQHTGFFHVYLFYEAKNVLQVDFGLKAENGQEGES